MLRHACGVLIHALTIVLAPYFLHAGACDADYTFSVCPAPFIMACLWVLVTQLLLTVQESNEHPLDGADVDDVFLELGEEFGDVLADAVSDDVGAGGLGRESARGRERRKSKSAAAPPLSSKPPLPSPQTSPHSRPSFSLTQQTPIINHQLSHQHQTKQTWDYPITDSGECFEPWRRAHPPRGQPPGHRHRPQMSPKRAHSQLLYIQWVGLIITSPNRHLLRFFIFAACLLGGLFSPLDLRYGYKISLLHRGGRATNLFGPGELFGQTRWEEERGSEGQREWCNQPGKPTHPPT
jgi:hypothetical protein